jgi:hypothetical protein
LFNFLNKKKESQNQETQKVPAPVPPLEKPLENFSKQNFNNNPSNNNQNFGNKNNQLPNYNPQSLETENKEVSFEIPDFTEEDIAKTIDLDELKKQNDFMQQKPDVDLEGTQVPETEKYTEELSPLEDKTNDFDFKEIDLSPQTNNLETPLFADEQNNIIETDDLWSLDEEDDNQIIEASQEEASQEELQGIDFDYESEEQNEEQQSELENEEQENETNTEKENQVEEIKKIDELEDEELPIFENEEELPSFQENEINTPKFMQKTEYKKIMHSIINAKETSEENIKEITQFTTQENQLKKHNQEIIKEINNYKEKLIEIDKQIFN